MTTRKVLLIDGDSEVYAAASAAECKRVVALVEGATPEGARTAQLLGPFPNVKETTAALPKGAAAIMFRSLEVATEEGAQLLLDARLRRVIAQAEERYGEMDVEIYLTGAVNYRHFLDHTYKGNRSAVQKPHWLGRLRNYVQEKYGARVTRTWEADDEVGIRATELGAGRAVICSVDKDLRQLPGHHIILGKGHLTVTERGAIMRLYCQILAGDSTDNVRGCWQVGLEGAFTYLNQILEDANTDSLSAAELEPILWTAVVEKYQRALDKYGSDKCRFIEARGAAIHTAQMVYLLRTRPEGDIPPRWVPPDARRS